MIPAEGIEEPKRPAPPPVPASDGETFEDRLRNAVVRHFRFAWGELQHAQRVEREKPASERSGVARPDTDAGASAEPQAPPSLAETPQPPLLSSAEAPQSQAPPSLAVSTEPPAPPMPADTPLHPPAISADAHHESPGDDGSGPTRPGDSGPTIPPARPPL